MTIDERQEELISQFELVDDWMDRYQMIIDLGDQLEPVDDAEHTSENLIDGCQEDGTLHLKADSDALITKGIAAMLLYCYNDQPAQAIVETPLYFIDRLGLQSHLSPTRSNGLQSMYETIRRRAQEFLSH